MVRKKLEDTQSIKIKSPEEFVDNGSVPVDLSDTQSIKIKPKRWKSIVLGLILILVLAIGGGSIGYIKGIQQRVSKENEEVISQAALHYQYGIQELEAGNYELARVQLEYVIQIYPDFPGVMEKYTEAMVKLAESGAPVEQAGETEVIIDTSDAEALFNQAVQAVQTQQWSLAIQTLEALRNENHTYRTIEVDGLYFTALRYRAVQLILEEGNLEEGLYFFALLEKYAPLDRDAVIYSHNASVYLTGASFWDIDWAQVVHIFEQLATAFPYMHDGNGWTATDRYLKGSEYYGDQLASEGKHCEAIEQYQNILNYSALDHIQVKYDQSYIECYPPTAVPEPTATESLEETPEETPTEEPTPTETPEPTATNDGGNGGGNGNGGEPE